MTTVHRLLDDAFAGVEVTAELQDLKEEIRASLTERVAELEGSGVPQDAAARRAFAELGDVGALIAEVAGAQPGAGEGGRPPRPGGAARPRTPGVEVAQLAAANRVRPTARFALGVVVASLALAALLAVAVLGALGAFELPPVATAVLLLTASSAAGFVVGLSLSQETTTNHPVPSSRAGGYYAATSLTLFGLLLAGFTAVHVFPAWMYVVAGVAVVGGVVVFTALGVTQTNRRKAWVREVAREQVAGDRFSQDPAAAARFGLYTVVIWVLAVVTFVVLGLTIGWAWSWLALVVAFAVMMLVLARMLFGAGREPSGPAAGSGDRG